MPTLYLLPLETAPGPYNMAADEALLRAAVDGRASLRFYQWSEPTVSLGYFQPAAARLAQPRLAALPFVRRPSGGATLVHHHELTYCLALPSFWLDGPARQWMVRLHRMIVNALTALAPRATFTLVEGESERHGDLLCFQQHTPGDVLCCGKKIAGSAQRKLHQALMQHGGILLAQSEHAPELPGLRDLAGVSLTAETLAERMLLEVEAAGWTVSPAHWTPQEHITIQEIIEDRYARREWNEKR